MRKEGQKPVGRAEARGPRTGVGGGWWWLYRPRRTAGLYPLPRHRPRRRRFSLPADTLLPSAPTTATSPSSPSSSLPLSPPRLSPRVVTHTDERAVSSFLESLPHPAPRDRSVTHSLSVSRSTKSSKGVNFSFSAPPGCRISCERVFVHLEIP